MTKRRKAKIEALKIASSIIYNCDLGMWDNYESESLNEQLLILEELKKISSALDKRIARLKRT